MELPRRQRGDELLRPGEMARMRIRLRHHAKHHDLSTVIACAFDHRTRILPFIYADLKIVPAGVRAIGSAMVDCGFEKTRIVLQQWNRRFDPSQMRLDGRIPDLFMVSSMHLHSAECDKLIRKACKIEPSKRPLIIAGGPKAIYDPWDVFNADPQQAWGADVAVTGEEYVLLELLDVLLSMRGSSESIRQTFLRARDEGALDQVAGLVYSNTSDDCVSEELVDTGIQRLLGDLDELPSPVHGYRIVEPPSRAATLATKPIPADRIRKYSPVSSLVLTFGCKFRCSYCPIPAYNQRQYRSKSGERVADEIEQIGLNFGIVNFFGADDNFFNNTERTLDICETLARKAAAGRRPFCKIRWATEATVHDTVRLREHLPVIRQAGLTAVWLGVEDITATLVRKGQSEDKTMQAFQLLRENGIFPIPMLMHHDDQPLYSRNKNYGLINQLGLLRKAGALYMQVLMLTPARGSNFFEETFTSGLAFKSVDGIEVEPHITDGNYVVASNHPRPWVKQLNLLAAYAFFFNPLRMLWALIRPKSRIPLMDAETTPPSEAAKFSA
ncbi:MAG: radical SAM protein, partial [Planctomycetes bacterium]|nr:radical SAM protein [Planctomycetota bacterium]